MAGLEDLSAADLEAIKLGRALMTNPEVRTQALRMAVKANPNLNVPEVRLLDAVDAVETRAQEREQRLEAELLKERVARKQSEKRQAVKDKGYDPDEIEKIIVDYGAKDYDAAMKIADMIHAQAEPTPADVRHSLAAGEPLDLLPGQKDRPKTPGDGMKTALSIAHSMVDEFRGRVKRRA